MGGGVNVKGYVMRLEFNFLGKRGLTICLWKR